MQAIILAAGMGMRLGPLTDDKPKALVRVAGRELILHVMDFLNHPAIGERIVVTGYEGAMLEEFLRSHRPDVITVRNPNFTAGSIRSIETAAPKIRGDFLIINVDHIYPKEMMGIVMEKMSGLTAVCDFDRILGADDMKVKLSDAGKLEHIKKTLDDFDCGYIGMTYCDADTLARYKDAIGDVRRDDGDKTSVEAVLGRLARKGCGASICDTSGIGWLEVDTPDDLMRAEATLNKKPDFLL